MANKLNPTVERYSILVSIPLESTDKESIKLELNKVRALLKHSEVYGARLEKMYNSGNKLKVSVSFSSIEKMIEFRDTMSNASLVTE